MMLGLIINWIISTLNADFEICSTKYGKAYLLSGLSSKRELTYRSGINTVGVQIFYSLAEFMIWPEIIATFCFFLKGSCDISGK